MSKTTNYNFEKQKLGHPLRDTFTAANLDMIDAAIKAGVNPLTSAKIIVGNVSNLAVGVVMSGDITIDNAGATTIGADKVVKGMVAADVAGTGITSGTGGKLDRDAIVLKGIVTAMLSFETNELTSTKIRFPFGATITKIRSIVTFLIAGTSDATITGNNGTGDSSGVVTVAQDSALNTEDEAVPTTNNEVEADGYYMLTTAKANAGGKVLVTLEYTQSI